MSDPINQSGFLSPLSATIDPSAILLGLWDSASKRLLHAATGIEHGLHSAGAQDEGSRRGRLRLGRNAGGITWGEAGDERPQALWRIARFPARHTWASASRWSPRIASRTRGRKASRRKELAVGDLGVVVGRIGTRIRAPRWA